MEALEECFSEIYKFRRYDVIGWRHDEKTDFFCYNFFKFQLAL